MNRAFALALVASVACHGKAAKHGPAASTKVNQPSRSAADTERMAALDHALVAALERAGNASRLADACGDLAAISKQIDDLATITPPVGLEQEFSAQCAGLAMKIDVLVHQTCADSSSGTELVYDDIARLRLSFSILEGVGAKP